MADGGKGFKVNDRRRFDEQGNERDGADKTESSANENGALRSKQGSTPNSSAGNGSHRTGAMAPSQSPSGVEAGGRETERHQSSRQAAMPAGSQRAEEFTMRDGDEGNGMPAGGPEQFGVSFASFVMSLATQALMQMGELEPPGGGLKLPPDFEAAKQTIEIIGMLAAKTKGNLDGEEQRLMTEVLHTLRITFVQRLKAAQAPKA